MFNLKIFRVKLKIAEIAHRKQLLACNLRDSNYYNHLKLTLKIARKTYPLEIFKVYSHLIKRKLYPNVKKLERYSKKNLSATFGIKTIPIIK